MLEVADIFRLHGPDYRAQFGNQLLPSHRRAMQDIETCRTESLGGQVYYCAQCAEQRYSYHSCKNRHCPKCQNEQANEWLQAQQSLLLPTHHFLVTFTLPAELRALARSNQKTIYNLLFRASAAALLHLAQDQRFVGARLDMGGVLHTWTRQLLYHPHVHYIATGGGLSPQGRWRSSRKDFLVPVKALSLIFRAKFHDELKKTELFALVAAAVWRKAWVVHSEPVGSSAQPFQYLAPYIFRVAISNNRLRKLEQGNVTFSYKESATDQLRHCTVTAAEFMVVSLFVPGPGELLSTSPPLSVCNHKKTSLTGLASALILSISPLMALLLSRPHFSARLAPFSCLFKLQVLSNPA